jgi:hypothetical protein
MKNASLIPHGEVASLVLSGAELSEILCRARADIGEELDFNATRGHAADSDVKKSHGITTGDRFDDGWVHGLMII